MTIREDIIEDATTQLKQQGYDPVDNEVRDKLAEVVQQIATDQPDQPTAQVAHIDPLLDSDAGDVPPEQSDFVSKYSDYVTTLIVEFLTPFEAAEEEFRVAEMQSPWMPDEQFQRMLSRIKRGIGEQDE